MTCHSSLRFWGTIKENDGEKTFYEILKDSKNVYD